MSKETYYQKAINWATKRGWSNIKANQEGYEQPTQFNRSKDDETFVPDITGRRRTNKHYAEIALKTDTKRRVITKWKLLSTLAGMKGGKLFLLAPHGHRAFVDRILKRHQLTNVKLVTLR